MTTFVCQQDDVRALIALSILEVADWIPCNVRVISSLEDDDEKVKPEEVVFFTPYGRKNEHWPSRWLRTSQSRVRLISPSWASDARAVIAIRLRLIESPGFDRAVTQVAAEIVGVKPPATEKHRQKRRRERRKDSYTY